MLDPLGLAQSFEVTSCWRPAVHLLRTRWVHLKSISSRQMSFSKHNGHLAQELSPQSLPCQLFGGWGTPSRVLQCDTLPCPRGDVHEGYLVEEVALLTGRDRGIESNQLVC